MVLPKHINSREKNCFVEVAGEVAKRVYVAGGNIIATFGGVEPSENITITNLSVPVADTEVSHALTANTKRLIIRARDVVTTKFAFIATESSTNYLTIKPAASREIDQLDFTGKTLYAQCSGVTTLEIEEYF